MNKKKILLIEDDAEDIQFVTDALTNINFGGEIQWLNNGQDAVDSLADIHCAIPDLILLDLNMPLLDGFEVLKRLRADERFQQTPVVVLTASSRKHDENKCKDLGCSMFISKPFSFEDYDNIMHRVTQIIS